MPSRSWAEVGFLRTKHSLLLRACGQNKPLFLLARVLPDPSDPFSLTSVASLPSGEGLSIDQHASKQSPLPEITTYPFGRCGGGTGRLLEQAWLRRLLGTSPPCPGPGLPRAPAPARASTPLQHFHSAPHNGVCPRSPCYHLES